MLYLETGAPDLHDGENTVAMPLVDVPFEQLCPGSAALDAFMQEFR
jgi:hypothetical protein